MKKSIQKASTSYLLDLYEKTNPLYYFEQISLIRGMVLNELSRRDPAGVRDWKDKTMWDGYQLRDYVKE